MLSAGLARADFTLEPHADLSFTSVGYPENVDPVVNSWLGIWHLQTSAQGGWSKEVKFNIRPEFQADPFNNTISERYWAELPEGYLQIKPIQDAPSELVIQAGFNTFTWGVTDGFNPLDIVSAKRYTDPFITEKLGAPSLLIRSEVPGGIVSFEGIYIPFQRKSIIPGNNNRWLPRQGATIQPGVDVLGFPVIVQIPDQSSYNLHDDLTLDSALNNNFGFRLEAHVQSLDLSFVLFDGAAAVPFVQVGITSNLVAFPPPAFVIQDDQLINITPIYYRQLVYGGSAVYPFKEFIFRAEAAFTRVTSRSPGLQGITNQFVVEAEHEFDIFGTRITGILEGTYGQYSNPQNSSLFSLPRMFDRAVIPGFRYAPTETFSVAAFAVIDTQYNGELGHAEMSDALNDNWKVNLAGELLMGSATTPIGSYSKNSRIIAGLKYSL